MTPKRCSGFTCPSDCYSCRWWRKVDRATFKINDRFVAEMLGLAISPTKSDT